MGGAPRKSLITRRGQYIVTRQDGGWVFRWGKRTRGIEVHVFRQGNAVAAHLVRHNVGAKPYSADRDGHLDVLVEYEAIRISDTYTRRHAYGSCAPARVIFAAMRVYAKEIGLRVRCGILEITSKRAQAVYHAYAKAFRRNGFYTDEHVPKTNRVHSYMLIFKRYIYESPKIEH